MYRNLNSEGEVTNTRVYCDSGAACSTLGLPVWVSRRGATVQQGATVHNKNILRRFFVKKRTSFLWDVSVGFSGKLIMILFNRSSSHVVLHFIFLDCVARLLCPLTSPRQVIRHVTMNVISHNS